MAANSDQLTNDLAALKIDRGEPPRRGVLRPVLYAAVLIAMVLGVWLIGYPYLNARVFKTPVELTEIALVSPAQGSIELTATGYVVAEVKAKVAAKTNGRIVELLVKTGDVVKKGDVIARLDDTEARQNLAAARTQIATARARAQAARAQLAETQLQIGRERTLVEKGVTPKAVLDDLVARQRFLVENVRAGEAEVKAAEAQAEVLEVALADATVTTPISGTVVEKIADVGELVGPLVMQAQNVVTVVDFASLLVEIDVPEGKLSLVKVGTPCEIVLDAYPGRRYRGAAHEIGKFVDRAKATVKVKVRFVDAPEGALTDMAARVSFLSKELDAEAMKEPARLVVPERALVDRGTVKSVYVVTADDKLSLTDVQVGDKLGAGYVLVKGPGPGTKVVANPSPELRDGQNIKERKN